MIDLNYLHPYPRYGVAAALVETRRRLEDITNWPAVASLAVEAIERALNRYTLKADLDPMLESTMELRFSSLSINELDPGKKSGQIAARGYYLAPYIITTDGSSAATVAEARAICDLLRTAKEEDYHKSIKLKRSFAPLTSKVNNGRASMAEPRATLLEAAFTVVATLTEIKPAAQVAVGKGMANTTVMPDLPLTEGDASPLIDFVQLFFNLRVKEGDPYRVAVDPKDRKYRRPPIFRGNYPNAPRDGSLGAISLVASIGAWAKEGQTYIGQAGDSKQGRGAFAKRVLDYLAERPLYILSYEDVRQESYGHHLVNMAIHDDLAAIVQAAHRARPFGVDKIDDPKYTLYKRFFNRFLMQFDGASFRDFMAFRNEYPYQLAPIFEQYMATEHKLTPDFIASARAYGQSLNRAAYNTGKAEQDDDIANKRRERPLSEYKNRILVQFESTILSAKTPTALLSQMGVIVGRLTGREIDSDAGLFMETVASWSKDELPLAQELVTAFMRLSSYRPKESASESTNTAEAVAADNPANDVMPA